MNHQKKNTDVALTIDARGIARVTLTRPEKHNAFDEVTIATLTDFFTQIAEDQAVRVVVIAAEGKSFSAGADLSWMRRMATYSEAENIADAQALATMLERLNGLPQPTIARVHGAAFGGALGIICCCDMAFGTSAARFCLSEVKLGLIPAVISPYVIAVMGERACRRYFQTAEIFSAEKACELGVLSEICDEYDLDFKLNACIDGLLSNGPTAMRAAKQLVFDVVNENMGQDTQSETSRRIAAIRASSEGQEGLTAFLEKRKPRWVAS